VTLITTNWDIYSKILSFEKLDCSFSANVQMFIFINEEIIPDL
jgi:hypothetical protein